MVNSFQLKGFRYFEITCAELQVYVPKDVSYDVALFFTNITINENIECILDQIYNKKRLKPIYSKLIFKQR